MIRSLAVTILVSCALLSRGAAQDITLDSARHTVVMRAGPFMAEPAEHSEHYGHAGLMDSDDPVRRFPWPCDAWLRGFALRLEDAEGRELPLRWIHHLKVVNFARRQLVYPITERLIAVSRESRDLKLPVSVGIPVRAGDELGVYVMWDAPDDAPSHEVFIRIELQWTPTKLLALRGEGLRLKAGRRYRIVAVYDNPTADTIPGAMGIIGGLFVPDDLRRWPAIDVTNADYRLDLELLGGAPTMTARRTAAGAQHE